MHCFAGARIHQSLKRLWSVWTEDAISKLPGLRTIHVQITNDRPSTTERKPSAAPLFPSAHLVPFILVTALFFLWGIPNNLNDVLIRQSMKSFAITRFQAALLQSASYIAYFVLA